MNKTLVEQLLEATVAALPDDSWALMVGRQIYDPIPGSPGQRNHPDLVGKVIWWASARHTNRHADGGFDSLTILSAERHVSIEAALLDLAAQLKARGGGA